MKKQLTFIIALLLLSISSFAQNRYIPERKDNTVIINTNDSLHKAFKNVKLLLIENGYTIAKVDNELNTIVTDPKACKDNNVVLTIHVKGEDKAKVVIRGSFSPSTATSVHVGYGVAVSNAGNYQIEYKGMKGSNYSNAWDEMSNTATLYKLHKGIAFEKR